MITFYKSILLRVIFTHHGLIPTARVHANRDATLWHQCHRIIVELDFTAVGALERERTQQLHQAHLRHHFAQPQTCAPT